MTWLDRNYSVGEFLAKAGYEGGLPEAILGYGLRATDLADDVPKDFRDAVQHVVDVAVPAFDKLEGLANGYDHLREQFERDNA
jgi:hypothetical protein